MPFLTGSLIVGSDNAIASLSPAVPASSSVNCAAVSAPCIDYLTFFLAREEKSKREKRIERRTALSVCQHFVQAINYVCFTGPPPRLRTLYATTATEIDFQVSSSFAKNDVTRYFLLQVRTWSCIGYTIN